MPPPVSVFVIDPPERLDPPTDTSLALMRESLARSHRVFYCIPAELRLENGRPVARAHRVAFSPGAEMFRAGPGRQLDLASIDILHMRKDPPVDTPYLHATYILDRLPPRVLQINPARALRSHCEKLIPLHFPDLLPESLVTCDPAELAAFLERLGHIVLKPLGECSGRGVIELTRDDPGREERCVRATGGGSRYVQGQTFLPAIAAGDKRVLLLGGEILGWIRRIPAAGDFRSNVNAGGRCAPCELAGTDRDICARLKPWLLREGIHLAGADIVGEHLLEVNITSPSCLREMNELSGTRLERQIVDYAEVRCRH